MVVTQACDGIHNSANFEVLRCKRLRYGAERCVTLQHKNGFIAATPTHTYIVCT